ncbi:DUF2809 domain-containing protein [Dethiothermospora halolimnae]|uniref:ribosomal maturation YjgA family protein n=1 Tax=Dethiothermospora halolimnae TaxID=3114390 RepID=UPI003CCBB0D1
MKRIIYFILIFITIILGLLSRKINTIPLYVGDILWATMICFIVIFINPKKSIYFDFFISLTITYGVEFSQLIDLNWLNNIRSTTLGHLVLGQGFLVIDLVAYLVGIVFALVIKRGILNDKL